MGEYFCGICKFFDDDVTDPLLNFANKFPNVSYDIEVKSPTCNAIYSFPPSLVTIFADSERAVSL